MLISLLITLLILGLVFWLVFWIIGLLPIPQPFKNVILAIFGIIAVIYIISILLGSVAPIHLGRY